MNIATVFKLVTGLAVANTILSFVLIRGFLAKHKSIGNRQHLEAFKGLARQQMYQALVQIVFLVGLGVIGLYGIWEGTLRLLMVIAMHGLVIIISKLLKSAEEKARSLPVEDASLTNEYVAVCGSWTGKALPDF